MSRNELKSPHLDRQPPGQVGPGPYSLCSWSNGERDDVPVAGDKRLCPSVRGELKAMFQKPLAGEPRKVLDGTITEKIGNIQ